MDALWLGWAGGGGARADINEFMVRHKKLMMHEREMKRVTRTGPIDVMLMIYGKTRRGKVAQLFDFLLLRSRTNEVGLAFQSTVTMFTNKWLNRRSYHAAMFPYQPLIDNWKIGSNPDGFQRSVDVSLTSHKIGNDRIKSGPLRPIGFPSIKPVKAKMNDDWSTVKFRAWLSAFSKISLNWK